MIDEQLEEMFYQHTLRDVVSLMEQHGYIQVLQDIVTILSQRNVERSIDNKDKQE